MDYLTVTVPSHVARAMCRVSGDAEAGHAQPGFAKSERRSLMGGKVWRKWDPHQPSKRFGTEYESWEGDGGDGSALLHVLGRVLESAGLRPGVVRASRVDVAWDFSVRGEFTADAACECFRPHFEAKGFTEGISGESGINTRYIGSTQSERRIRIYRKDLQSDAWAIMYGPLLRVECTTKGPTAEALCRVLLRDGEQAGFAAASAHVEQMTGERMQPEVGEVPVLAPTEDVDVSQEVFAFVRQHGSKIDAYWQAGIDVLRLAQEAKAQAAPVTHYRHGKRIERIAKVGSEVVAANVRAMLDPRPIRACPDGTAGGPL